MLILDTHVLVWLDEANNKLGKMTRNVIDDALLGDTIGIAAISFWEIAMLVKKGKISIGMELELWRRDLLQKGLYELQIDGAIAIRAGQLENIHGDPADRLIVATTIEHSATLVTADRKILDWQGGAHMLDASL